MSSFLWSAIAVAVGPSSTPTVRCLCALSRHGASGGARLGKTETLTYAARDRSRGINQGSNRSNRSDGGGTRILRRRRAPARHGLNCGLVLAMGIVLIGLVT